MSELRRMLLANATEQASNGGDLPTNIVASSVPNEDNARIYEYLKSLRAEQTVTLNHIICAGVNISMSTSNGQYQLYPDGRFEFLGSGGGAD